MLLRTRGKLITAGTRLLVVGFVAGLLLCFTAGSAEDGSEATAKAAPAPIRQKYVVQNIVSDGTIGANLSRLKTQFLLEMGNQYGDVLDVEPENREWLETEKCKTGQSCDLVTIDVDNEKTLMSSAPMNIIGADYAQVSVRYVAWGRARRRALVRITEMPGERVFISLAQSNQTFAYTDVLRQLNGMADAVSFLLEQEQQVTKISVGFKGVSGAGWSRLGEMILDRLKDAQELEPRLIDTSTPSNPPADYTLSGRVFSESSKLWFEVEVRNRRGRSFKKVFEGLAQNESTDAQKLETFYKEKSLIAIDYLSFIRNIADTDEPQPPSDLEATEALRQSRELLCRVEPSAGCVPQASRRGPPCRGREE